MLAFLRKIRRSIFGSGPVRKYFLYTIGEITLVVIGILIALQINNWNENKKERKEEIKTLTQLLDALDLEINDLKWNTNSISGSMHSIAIIRDYLINDFSYHDSLDYHFGNSSKTVGFIVKPAVYENLKFSGLGLISNDNLRNKIVAHYDYHSSYLTEIEKSIVVPHYNNNMLPAMIEKFDFSWILKPAAPISYHELRTDSQYVSLIKTTNEILFFQLKRTEEVLTSAQDLQSEIRKELNRLK